MRRPILDIRRWNVLACEACGKGSERRDVSFMFTRACRLEALCRLLRREGNRQQSVEGAWVWNFGRVRRLEFKGWNTGAEGDAWRRSSKICIKAPLSIILNTKPQLCKK